MNSAPVRRLLCLLSLCASSGAAQQWVQWGHDARHTGRVQVAAQDPGRVLAEIVVDPFVEQELAETGGSLLAHYPVPLVAGNDLFTLIKSGRYVNCVPPGLGGANCGPAAWGQQVWNIRRYTWRKDELHQRWTFASDWKPPVGLTSWEPVFQAALANGSVYVPGAGGTVFRLNRTDGKSTGRLNPFPTVDPRTFVAGPLTVNPEGDILYNAIQLDPASPTGRDILGAWLVKIASDNTITKVEWSTLIPGAPRAGDACTTTFPASALPWPPSPSAAPVKGACGSQRPGFNVAPAVARDGTIYTLSRAHFNSRYAYLVAVNSDLTPKWAASLRDRLNDGCNTPSMPANGKPGGCRDGTATGVDPATNEMPAGRVIDEDTASPTIAPDGSILQGTHTTYNGSRGHLFKFSPTGEYQGAFDFGWDTTPAIYMHDGTYSILLKDNHYAASYCGDERYCPPAPERYYITSLKPDLTIEWQFQSSNTRSCARNENGTIDCVDDHPFGFEWCINAPAVDKDGLVYANSEDGGMYVIEPGGKLRKMFFLNLALGAAYTPVSIGPDGKIFAQNGGRLLILGQ